MFSANGSQVSSAANYIEDVFSTYLYSGNYSTQSIVNGVDLAGKGGLVWIKQRSGSASSHVLVDTVRGASKLLYSNETTAQFDASIYDVSAFNANGFSLNNTWTDAKSTNSSGQTYASWTFRKQPKFFDVVTFMANGSSPQTISHSLGSTPGCIIVKSTDNASSWLVYHRGLSDPNNQLLNLNGTGAIEANSGYWGSGPTSTTFQMNTAGISGWNFVAYVFAHDAGGFGLTGTDNVISCGSFTTDSGGNATVNLGYEPQWILTKRSISPGGNWLVLDTMRGLSQTATANLIPNTSGAETTSAPGSFKPTATGFAVTADAQVGGSDTWIYIAIRRGPMKVPTDGTTVFDVGQNRTSIANQVNGTVGPMDMTMQTQVPTPIAGYHFTTFDRLRGASFINTSTTNGEAGGAVYFDTNVGVRNGTWFSNGGLYYNFKRSPSFFDVVCYKGTGANRTVTHNLGVTPELIIVKRRDDGVYAGRVYHKDLGSNYWLYLFYSGSDAAVQGPNSGVWNGAPTSTIFNTGNDNGVNASGSAIVAYLFATCAGVSKVGTVTLAGATVNVNCGFAAGARFVMLKRTSGVGDWYVFDTARGINAGNDPYLRLNSTAAEANVADVVDAYSAGFTVNGAEWDAGDYIYLAIA